MLEYLVDLTPYSWWSLCLFALLAIIFAAFKKLDFSDVTYNKTDIHKELGANSEMKFSNQEYYSLCLELIHSWQWQIKMKLNISFQSYGLNTINEYILTQFTPAQLNWVELLLNNDLNLDEKNKAIETFTINHYQMLKLAIKQDIHYESK